MNFLIAYLLIAANVFAVTEARECYTCWDVVATGLPTYPPDLIPGIKGHPSCRKGWKPDDSLKATCPIVRDDNGNEVPLVCTQLSLTMTVPPGVPILPPDTSASGTLRGCFHYDATVEDLGAKVDSCSQKNYQQMLALSVGPFKAVLEELETMLPFPIPPTIAADFCHCKTDNCMAYDECAVENPPEHCSPSTGTPSTQKPPDGGTSSSTEKCTGDNCDPAHSIHGGAVAWVVVGLVAWAMRVYSA